MADTKTIAPGGLPLGRWPPSADAAGCARPQRAKVGGEEAAET